jgi:hypothetical protein
MKLLACFIFASKKCRGATRGQMFLKDFWFAPMRRTQAAVLEAPGATTIYPQTSTVIPVKA